MYRIMSLFYIVLLHLDMYGDNPLTCGMPGLFFVLVLIELTQYWLMQVIWWDQQLIHRKGKLQRWIGPVWFVCHSNGVIC